MATRIVEAFKSSFNAGIVGLPNVGKSTLFILILPRQRPVAQGGCAPCGYNRISVENGKAQAANFPFCTIEPNVGIVAVPDPRLQVLSNLSKSQKSVPASIEFVDISGLVKGASQGELRSEGKEYVVQEGDVMLFRFNV